MSIDVAVTGDGKREADPEAMQRWVAGAESPHAGRRRAHAAGRVLVLAGLQRDVVAEPLRLLVGVGVTADVDEQRRVVDDGSLLLVEPEPLRESQRDQALAQNVLHRLAEAEVDPQRERRHQLRQADASTISIVVHRWRVNPRHIPLASRHLPASIAQRGLFPLTSSAWCLVHAHIWTA